MLAATGELQSNEWALNSSEHQRSKTLAFQICIVLPQRCEARSAQSRTAMQSGMVAPRRRLMRRKLLSSEREFNAWRDLPSSDFSNAAHMEFDSRSSPAGEPAPVFQARSNETLRYVGIRLDR